MLGMAKKPTKKEHPQGRARDRGEVRLLNVEIPVALDDALEACRKDERRLKKVVVIAALEVYLKARKFWPPPTSTAV
jgi:hypothetical protein